MTYQMIGDEKCAICLGEGDEIPPMGKPTDAHDWVKPCSCSLVAHRKCMVSWALSTDLDHRKTQFLNERSDYQLQEPLAEGQDQRPEHFSFNLLNRIGINIRTEPSHPRLLPPSFAGPNVIICVSCPQCSNPIFLQNRKDQFNLSIQRFRDFVISGTRFLFYSTAISTSVASTIAGLCATSSSMGIQILNIICPESVQMRLLHIPARNLVDALNRNILSGRFFTVTTLLPVYLLMFRQSPSKTGSKTECFVQTFPLLFLSNLHDLESSARGRMGIFLLSVSRYAYNLLFSLTFNRLYYRWTRSSLPSFIADRLSLEELERIQRENEQEYEIQLQEEQKNQQMQLLHQKRTIFQRIMDYFLLSSKLKQVKQSRRRRELENCLKYDYSSVFNKSSLFFTMFSTMVWPYLGERFSHLVLSKSKYVLNLLNKYAKTPDETVFLRNLLGCCCVILLKDLVNLYLSWRKAQQLNSVDILEFGSDEWTKYSLLKVKTDLQQQRGYDTDYYLG